MTIIGVPMKTDHIIILFGFQAYLLKVWATTHPTLVECYFCFSTTRSEFLTFL